MGLHFRLFLCSFILSLSTLKISSGDEGKIIGGRDVQPGEYPYQICMTGEAVKCGGGLVTMRQFMTAAHCFIRKTKKTDLTKHFIVAGVVDCGKTDDPFYQKRGIKDYKMRKEFHNKKDMTSYYDFAIGIVDKPFDESERAKPGKLPSTDFGKFRQMWLDIVTSEKTCSVMGFGTTTAPLIKDSNHQLKLSKMKPKTDKYCKGTLTYDTDKMLEGEVCCVPVKADSESMGIGDAGSVLDCNGFMYGVNTGGYFQPEYNLQLFTLAYPYLDLIEEESGGSERHTSKMLFITFGIFTEVVVNVLCFKQ